MVLLCLTLLLLAVIPIGMSDDNFDETDMQRIMAQSNTILPERKCNDCGGNLSYNPLRYYGGYGCNPCSSQ